MTNHQSTVKHHLVWTAWSPRDDREMRRMYEAGLAYSDIGRVLGRTTNAVRQRRARLRLTQTEAERGRGRCPLITHLATETGVVELSTGRQWRVRYGECPVAAADMHGAMPPLPPATLEAGAASAAWGVR